MISVNTIKNELGIKTIEGIIHYGSVDDKDIHDYNINNVKKVIWMHPNQQTNSSTYFRTSGKRFQSHFSSVQLMQENKTPFQCRFDEYIKSNISYINLDKFNIIKINSIPFENRMSSEEVLSILKGIGDRNYTVHESIRAFCLPNNSNDIEIFLKEFRFELKLIDGNDNRNVVYVR